MFRKLLLSSFAFILLLNASPAFAAFPDVSQDNSYYYDIARLQKLYFVQGDEKGNFNPDQGVNRCEMAKFSIMLFEAFTFGPLSSSLAPTHSAFPDIPVSHWCNFSVWQLKYLGVVNGDVKGNFDPWRKVTNAEAFKMILKAAQVDTHFIETEYNYTAQDWQKTFMAYVTLNELEAPAVTQTLEPNTVASRKTIARVISRLMNKKNNRNFTQFEPQSFNFTFWYPKDYTVEEAGSLISIFKGTYPTGNRFNLEYLKQSEFDMRMQDCQETRNIYFSKYSFTKIVCINMMESHHGYYTKVGNEYLFALHSYGDRKLEDFEDVLSSLDLSIAVE